MKFYNFHLKLIKNLKLFKEISPSDECLLFDNNIATVHYYIQGKYIDFTGIIHSEKSALETHCF